ncbi:MAG: phage tail tip fiber protein, partial [Streptosporangiales bacterium]
MPFQNPVVGQTELIRKDIESRNYVEGESGWRIARDGDAEFNDLTT